MRLVRHALGNAPTPCELEVAADGSEALDRVRDALEGPGFDLVLTDLDLPDLSGHEVCERIRSQDAIAHLPVIVLTSADEPATVRASYRAGANGHVPKAVDFESFREDLCTLLSFWLDVNRAPRDRAPDPP